MSDDLHLTGKAPRTHNGYLRAVRRLDEFAKTQPDHVTEAQVPRFFLHLKNERNFAYGSLRVALSGVKFFFSVTGISVTGLALIVESACFRSNCRRN
jgi:integrase/recombinase XerD